MQTIRDMRINNQKQTGKYDTEKPDAELTKEDWHKKQRKQNIVISIK